MRYLVLLFGLAGVGGSGFVAYQWGTQWLDQRTTIEQKRGTLESQLDSLKTSAADPRAASPQREQTLAAVASDTRKYNDDALSFYSHQRVLAFLLAGAILGLFGTLLGFLGRGFSGGLLLLATGGGPAIFNLSVQVPGNLSLPLAVFTGGLAVAGLLSFFVRRQQLEDE